MLYYSALLEPILNKTLTNRTLRVRGGSKLNRTLRFCANSNNSANASDYLGVPPSPHRFSILFCFARDFFEKVWAMGRERAITLYGSLAYSAMEYYTLNNMPRAIYAKEHQIIVERLKRARIEAGLGQIEVARKLGKTQSYLSKIESGQRRFDVLQLKDFAKVYKKDISFFIK